MRLAVPLFVVVALIAFNALAKDAQSGKSPSPSQKSSALKSKTDVKRKPNNEGGMQATSLDPAITDEQLRAVGYTPSVPVQANEIPNPQVRDAIFDRAGFSPYVVKLDQFDRDILFMRAARYSPDKLAGTYKRIPRAALQKLQVEIANAKNGK